MLSRDYFVRWCGPAAMLGGALWVAGILVHASKPRGCIAEECAFRPMRESGVLDGTLMLLSMLLFMMGTTGLVTLVRRAGRFGKIGRTGVSFGAVGAALLVVSGLVQAVFFAGDFQLMPYFVVPGVLALVAGFLLLGIAILRAGVLPRWAAILLVVGALAMLGFNEQTARVLMGIPFGLAWVAVGYVLWSGPGAPAGPQTTRVR